MKARYALLLLILVFSIGYPVAADAYDTLNVTMIAGVPVLTTNESTNVEETTVTLHGYLVTDGGAVCQYRFEYDIDSGEPYASATAWVGAINADQTFSQGIFLLTEGELYYFRAQCRNVNGQNSGGEKRFLTKPDGPVNFQAVRDDVLVQINLAWTKGDGADKTFISRKIGSYPIDRSDGVAVYNGTANNYEDGAVIANNHYYYRAWSYCSEEDLHRFSDEYDEDSCVALAPATFDIRDIIVDDDIIPELNVSVIVENKGDILADITVSWVLKRVDNDVVLDMGSDTFAVSPHSEVLYDVKPSTAYLGHVMITFTGDGASASKTFYTRTTPAPPPPGGAPRIPRPPVVPPVVPPIPAPPAVPLFLIFFILGIVSFFILLFILYRREKEEEEENAVNAL